MAKSWVQARRGARARLRRARGAAHASSHAHLRLAAARARLGRLGAEAEVEGVVEVERDLARLLALHVGHTQALALDRGVEARHAALHVVRVLRVAHAGALAVALEHADRDEDL